MPAVGPGRLVETLESHISALEIEFHRAYWDSQIEASESNERRRSELELELRRVKGDSEALASVNEALNTEIHDPVIRRQLEVLRLSLTGNQMDEAQRKQIVELSSAVESEFANHRPLLGDKRVSDNEIEDILRDSNSEDERRAAWAASKEIGELAAPKVRELARLRNQAARKLGFSDYYRMSLDLQELDETWLFDLFDELATLTEAPFKQWKTDLDGRLADRFGTPNLAPWHYADPFFQTLPPDGRVELDELLGGREAPDLALRTFAAWNIDLAKVIESSDLYPRANKCQHAFCIDIDRSGTDVRILANVTPGERWMEVMLHESGHAAYDVCIDPKLPYLLRRASHIFVTEAAALLSGRMVREPVWLETFAGIDREDVDRIASDLRKANAAQSLLFARWCMVMTHFERELYSDPEADLDTLWWELVERFQLVQAPAGRQAPDWAAKIHIAVAPVYYQNYLLGDVLASQLMATAEREFGGLLGVPAAGEFLIDRLFRPGSLMRWDALIEEATGRALSPQDLAAELQVLL
ncbi:MAG: peptidyl-dipeptidase [Actinomycetota bacterium]|nr:peptidyl-dipeptidase [Actinomycetota bacterium]